MNFEVANLGLLPGVLKLAVVTWLRKESTWHRLSALCNVSRGRIVGVPSSPTELRVLLGIFQEHV